MKTQNGPFQFALMAATAFCAAPGPAPAQSTDAEVLAGVRLDQRLDNQVPLAASLIDEQSRSRTLKEIAGGRPIVLVPVFYRCPMLCAQVLNALARTVQSMSLTPGEEYTIVIFSIDARETPSLAREKKLNYLKRHHQVEAADGWHFLTAGQSTIDALTEAIGYHYVYDEKRDGFAHPAAFAILTPEGRVSRYVLGLDYQPRDLRFALIEASDGKVGSFVDHALLRCFAYDPTTGRYGFAIMTAVRASGIAIVGLLACTIVFFERRRRRLNSAGGGEA